MVQMKKPLKPLSIQIDAKSAVPVYEQVKQAIKWSILSGHLEKGDQLPSLRELAAMLRINPNTIVKVYFHLEVEGFIEAQAGSGFFVKADRKAAVPEARRLFEQLTEEYLARAVALGFTPEDITAHLQKKAAAEPDSQQLQEEAHDHH